MNDPAPTSEHEVITIDSHNGKKSSTINNIPTPTSGCEVVIINSSDPESVEVLEVPTTNQKSVNDVVLDMYNQVLT